MNVTYQIILSLITACFTGFVGYLIYKLKKRDENAQDLETMTILYNAYHNLSGNGTITAVYEKILALPIKAGV